jgi:hypothetical protein
MWPCTASLTVLRRSPRASAEGKAGPAGGGGGGAVGDEEEEDEEEDEGENAAGCAIMEACGLEKLVPPAFVDPRKSRVLGAEVLSCFLSAVREAQAL